MFIPYKDDNPRILIPYVTYTILALNILVFLYQLGLNFIAGQEFTLSYGLIPATLTDLAPEDLIGFHSRQLSQAVGQRVILDATPHTPLITIFTSMFMHGGLMHILFNMLFLWVFGDNVESSFGHVKFAVFYILCGVGAALSQIVIDINSIVPMIGASGAVSGVLAAYMLRFPRAKVHVFVFLLIFFTTVRVSAFIVIGIWFLNQLSSGIESLGVDTTGGVAWFAHIGGFLAGLIIERAYKLVRFRKY